MSYGYHKKGEEVEASDYLEHLAGHLEDLDPDDKHLLDVIKEKTKGFGSCLAENEITSPVGVS